MAAEAIVSFALQRLNDLIRQEAQYFQRSLVAEVRRIETELKGLRSLLKDADEKQKPDPGARVWLTDVIDITYDADDAIDSVIRSERAKIEHMRQGFVGWVKRYTCIFCEFKTQYVVAREIGRVRSKINLIRRIYYGGMDINEVEEEASSPIQTSYDLFEESDVVGLQADIENLKGWLINGEPRRCVIPIVGMGGIGKTTLAKKAYHDVKDNFDCHAFISLPEQCIIRDLLVSIIKSVMSPSSEEVEKSNKDNLEMILHNHLKEKRYLVVLDDVWNSETWDALKPVLPDGLNGSRVMLITRNQGIALHAGPSSHLHMMRLLNDDESWELFLKRIFPRDTTPIACPLGLEETGRMILAKCHGLPRAIVVLGGILSGRDKTLHAWSEVLERESSWDFSEKLKGAIASSYNDLPYYLRPCFLYFGAFPEDSQICSKKLMRLWIAEGFIFERGNKIIEDVAKEYLEELSNRSIIQVASRRSDRSVCTFCIHDILHYISISESKQTNFFTISNYGYNSDRVRRLALHTNYPDSERIHTNYPDSERTKRWTAKLRSLLCFSKSAIDLTTILHTKPKLLRVLDAEDVKFSEQKLLKEIGKLARLRYLNLRNTCIDSLPNSIGKLLKLQSLDIRGTRVRPMTTTAIQKLEQLQYLYMDMDDGSTDGDSLDVSSLESLRVLSVIRVGQWMEDGLGKLIHLQKLGIYGDLYLYSFAQDLHKLTNLRSLRLGFGFGDEFPLLETILSRPPPGLRTLHLERPLQKLPDPDKFPSYLTKLCLKRSLLEQDQMETLKRLRGLRVLKLGCGSFLGKKLVCSAGGFLELRFLELDLLDELEEWIVEEGAMPKLTHLVIRLCNRLKELPRGLLHLYHQNELEVTEMPETFIASLQRNKGKEIQPKSSVTMGGNGISMGASSSSQL